MVAGFMVTIPKEARDAGWRLLELLEHEQIVLSGLFWAEAEPDDWRLHLVTDRIGRGESSQFWLEVLTLMNNTVEHSEEFSFLRYGKMTAVDPKSQIVKQIRDRYKSVTAADRRSVRRISLGSEDAYVYFLK